MQRGQEKWQPLSVMHRQQEVSSPLPTLTMPAGWPGVKGMMVAGERNICIQSINNRIGGKEKPKGFSAL